MQFLSFFSGPLFKKISIYSAIIAIVIFGFYGWLFLHDKAIVNRTTDEINAVWVKKLAEASLVTTVDTVWQTIPAKPGKPVIAPSNVISSEEHKRVLDSTQAYWTKCNARKDSLLEVYTEDRESTFSDSLQDHIVGFTPLGTFGRIPLSFQIISSAKEQKVPIIHTSNTLYVPEIVPWYKTKEAYFFYGVVTTSAVFYASKKF